MSIVSPSHKPQAVSLGKETMGTFIETPWEYSVALLMGKKKKEWTVVIRSKHPLEKVEIVIQKHFVQNKKIYSFKMEEKDSYFKEIKHPSKYKIDQNTSSQSFFSLVRDIETRHWRLDDSLQKN